MNVSSGNRVIISYYAGGSSRAHKGGALATALILMAALVPLACFMHSSDGPFLHVASGRLFASGFDRDHVGTVLDQPTIGKWFLIFTVFAAVVLPYLTIARWLCDRWLCDRRTRWGYWSFAIPAAALCLYLLITLTVPFYWLLQYIHAMGFTPRRIEGLVYGVASYVILLGFFSLAIWVPKEKLRAS